MNEPHMDSQLTNEKLMSLGEALVSDNLPEMTDEMKRHLDREISMTRYTIETLASVVTKVLPQSEYAVNDPVLSDKLKHQIECSETHTILAIYEVVRTRNEEIHPLKIDKATYDPYFAHAIAIRLREKGFTPLVIGWILLHLQRGIKSKSGMDFQFFSESQINALNSTFAPEATSPFSLEDVKNEAQLERQILDRLMGSVIKSAKSARVVKALGVSTYKKELRATFGFHFANSTENNGEVERILKTSIRDNTILRLNDVKGIADWYGIDVELVKAFFEGALEAVKE